jgi:hypothetical protein
LIVTIHQPNYFPWVGFFNKASKADLFVLLDNVPFSKNSYQNRCRIKTAQGAAWLTVPVKTSGRFGQSTDSMEILDCAECLPKHWRTLSQNYVRAPFFEWFSSTFAEVYTKEWKLLADLNAELIGRVLTSLGIQTPLVRSSTLEVTGSRSELLFNVCKTVGATKYLSGPSGRNYLDEQVFRSGGIEVVYNQFTPFQYPQLYGNFEPALSMLDLMANCGPSSKQLLVEAGGVVQ